MKYFIYLVAIYSLGHSQIAYADNPNNPKVTPPSSQSSDDPMSELATMMDSESVKKRHEMMMQYHKQWVEMSPEQRERRENMMKRHMDKMKEHHMEMMLSPEEMEKHHRLMEEHQERMLDLNQDQEDTMNNLLDIPEPIKEK